MIYGIKKAIIIYSTILHFACESGNLELVEYLISLKYFKDYDLNSKDIFLFSF